jgi:hypothetical protein
MRADRPVAAERPSRRAGRDDGRRRSERERDFLKRRDERVTVRESDVERVIMREKE